MKGISRDTVLALRVELRYCREEGISFDACLAEARKQHAKEVREAADATPLEEVARPFGRGKE